MLNLMLLLQRKGFAFCLIVLTFICVNNTYANDSNPYDLMQKTSESLFGQVTTEQTEIKKDPNRLKIIVKNTLMPYVHVKYAGSMILGTQLRNLQQTEKSKFFYVLSDFIIQNFAQTLTLYNGQKIEIEKAKPIASNIVNIKVKIIQTNGAAPVNLNFFWRKNSKTGAWQVYDIAVEGVSMVDTKRQEWSPILREFGINGLIEKVEKAALAPITFSK